MLPKQSTNLRFIDDLLREPAYAARPALVEAAGGATITYRELDAAVDAAADALRAQGAGPGGIVAIAAQKSIAAVIAMLAAMRAGAAAAPLDPAAPAERIAGILTRAEPVAVVADDEWLEVGAAAAGNAALLRLEGAAGTLQLVRASAVRPVPKRGRDPQDLAYLIHTSGSTGRPKGVAIRHSNVLAFLQSVRAVVGYPPDTRFLNVSPLYFDASVLDLYGIFDVGGTVVLLGDVRMATQITRALEEHAITDTLMVSSVLRLLVSRFSDIRSRDLSALRSLWYGAEACPVEVLKQLAAVVPGLRFIHGYGPTETTHSATLHVVDDISGCDEPFLPIGRALPTVELRVEREDGSLASAGEAGELLIGGPQLMAGYHRDPQLTAAAVVDRGGKPFYRSGDLVTERPDGALTFLGRRDDAVKVGGNLVHLGEVEGVALREPGVADAIAVTVPDAIMGTAIVLFVVSDAHAPSEAALREKLQASLPRYMEPRRILFIGSGEVPRGPTGKADRAALRARSLEAEVPA